MKFSVNTDKLKILFLVLGLIVMQALVSCDLLLFDVRPEQHLVEISIFCFTSFIIELYCWKRISGEVFSPYIIFFSVLFVFCCGQSVGWALGIDLGGQDLWNRKNFGMDIDNISAALCYSMLSLSFFIFGSIVQFDKKTSIYSNQFSREDIVIVCKAVAKNLLYIVLPAFLITSAQIFLAVLSYGYSGYYSEIGSNSLLMNLCFYISGYYEPLLLLLFVAYSYNRLYRNFILICMLIQPLLQLFAGGRSGAVMTVLGICLAWHYFVEPIKGKSAIIFSVIGYFGVILLNTIALTRNNISTDLLTFFSLYFEGAYSALGHILGELGWSLTSTIWTMMLIPEVTPYYMGISYFVALTAPIPNLGFWEVHPAKQYAQLGDWLEQELNYGHGIGYSMVAESYANFGWFGILMMFVMGYIISKFISSVTSENIEHNYLGAIFQILIIMTMMKPLIRSSFSMSLRSFAYVLLPLYITMIYYLNKRKIKGVKS